MREQSIADSVEHKCMQCFGTNLIEPADILGGILSAGEIRKNLMYSLSIFLARYYRCGNEKYDKKVDDFLNKNQDFFNKSIDDIGENLADEIVYEFEDILDMYKFE
ncbi:MAG: hypothetical protein E6Z22_04210 [Clostridiales bacterium]|nr:hypothetical protein [Clostridiales bacterium]